jgi:hypothetical protein
VIRIGEKMRPGRVERNRAKRGRKRKKNQE